MGLVALVEAVAAFEDRGQVTLKQYLVTRLRGAMIDELRRQPGITRAKLGSQTHALGFYERLGFIAEGPVYDDAGIPHRDMVMVL